MTSRLTQFALILTTMLALLASSVSACTCSHHEVEPVAEMVSCHHDSEKTPAESPDAEAIDVACTCYVNLPTPFIIRNSEQRSAKLEKQVPAVLPAYFVTRAERLVTISALTVVHSDTPIYLSREQAFTPSRAPPRL